MHMASMEDVNGQLNAAKVGFEQGALLTQSGAAQAEMLHGQLGDMWDLVRRLQAIDIVTSVEALAATIAVARELNSEAVGTLRATFPEENTEGLNPHIQTALTEGNKAHRYLVEGEQVGPAPPIGLEGIQQRVQRIETYLAALFEEVDSAHAESRTLRRYLKTGAGVGNKTVEAITAYQQQHGMQ